MTEPTPEQIQATIERVTPFVVAGGLGLPIGMALAIATGLTFFIGWHQTSKALLILSGLAFLVVGVSRLFLPSSVWPLPNGTVFLAAPKTDAK